MGQLMDRELVDEIQAHNVQGQPTGAIIPCGPTVWYRPFTELVNAENVSLNQFVVFYITSIETNTVRCPTSNLVPSPMPVRFSACGSA